MFNCLFTELMAQDSSLTSPIDISSPATDRGGKTSMLSPAVRFSLVAFLVGILTGLTASALKWSIESVTKLLTSHLRVDGVDWPFLILPVIGILCAGIYQRYILKHDISHGADKVTDFVKSGKSNLPPYMIYAPFLASTITLGFGGSAGSEGPVATSGAAIGSNVARKLGMTPDEIRTMICIGAGAGIAGIFKSPIGGALFTIEVMAVSMSSSAIVSLIIATLTSALVAFICSGMAPDIAFPDIQYINIGSIAWGAAAGLVCGIYSCYYSFIMKKLSAFFQSFNNQWLRNISSGIVIAIGVFCFPSLYGEGYGVISKMLAGDPAAFLSRSVVWNEFGSYSVIFLMTLCVALYKVFATAATNCGGGVAGDFAPTLFAGAVVGFLFTSIMKWVGIDLPVADCVMLCMAGVMAGTIKAPLMAMFLSMEMAMSFRLFLPVAIVTGVSYCVRIVLMHEFDYFKLKHDSQSTTKQ